MVSLTSILAQLWQYTENYIAQIIALLKDDDSRVRAAGVEALSQLSEQGT